MARFPNRPIRIALAGLFVLALLLCGKWVWGKWPHPDPQPLPGPLVSVDSAEGQARLARADPAVDHRLLGPAYQPQQLTTFCGVATAATVLSSLGQPTNQFNFFNDQTRPIRSSFQVITKGMSLVDLAALLEAHGVTVRRQLASDINLEAFRQAVIRNLGDPNDLLVVNYQRHALGQVGRGHISPVSAYDSATDSVLVLDTATHKYPQTWVPVPLLYDAMATLTGTGKSRGYIEIRLTGAPEPSPPRRVSAASQSREEPFLGIGEKP